MRRIKVSAAAAVAAVVLSSLAACRAAEHPLDEERARAVADELAQRLAGTLMGRLEQALQQGGPAAAAQVCSEVAQAVTAEVGAAEGAVLRRTALRLRNPANRPDDYERAWLQASAEAVAEGQAPQASYEVIGAGEDRALRHLRPIVFPGGVCAQCHGRDEELATDAMEIIRARYPDDEAVGFAPGDLRGAISVRVPLPPL